MDVKDILALLFRCSTAGRLCILLSQPCHEILVGIAFYPNLRVEAMKIIIQMSEAEEVKALPILLRHSPGAVLPHHIYVVSDEAARKLREAGVQFTELSRESNAPRLEGVGSGERI